MGNTSVWWQQEFERWRDFLVLDPGRLIDFRLSCT